MWLKTSGTIVYDPHRFDMKKRTKWWCVVNLDKEITRYYRYWVMHRYWIDLEQPSWDAHVSVIRGEEPPDNLKQLWKKYDGQTVEMWYNHSVFQAKKKEFWTLDVKSEFLTNIRKEFGFKTDWDFHLTIGKAKY